MGSGATKREILEKRLQDPKIEPLISLPLDFLEDITCGFSTERVLGTGGYGVVYKGVLRSGKTIAVKKIFDNHLLDNHNRVENEIICLTEIRHQNIVQLVGYCVETKKELMEHSGKHVMAEKCACLLCFEFLCNGSLDKYVSDDTLGLDWDMRYEIIRGVCRGLHYLHDKRRIVHRDLKPQNILMDDMMMPKIADFDLSRFLGQEKSRTVTANFAGTLGYMAPECIEQQFISFAADIFSLGVIIIEIITGCRDYPNISNTTETSLKHYRDEVVGSWRNRLIEITPTHMSPEMRIQQVQDCISIALKCLKPESNKRPTSLDIVKSLNAVEPKCTSPGNPPSVIEKVLVESPQEIHGGDGVFSRLVQETVGRVVSFALGKREERREEKASQAHLTERLEMAVSQLEFALERAQELRIRHLSLISRRKMIRRAYVEAMELLDRYKQQQPMPPGQELQISQGVMRNMRKRKRWLFWAKDVPITSSFASLSTDDVRRFELYADYAEKFVRDVESGCSLHHYTFCNPIVRRLLEGKTLRYNFKQGNLARVLVICPMYSEERGVEAALRYSYEDSTMAEKCFTLWLTLRLSESTDIVGLAIKGLQLLTAEFKHPVESAMAELTLVPNLQLQDIAHLSGPALDWHRQELFIQQTEDARPDPACCKGSRHGHCAEDIVSSGLADIFPEQVIHWVFHCRYVPALESSTRSSFDELGRGCMPPLGVTIGFRPHYWSHSDKRYARNWLRYTGDLLEKGNIMKYHNYICALEMIGRDVDKYICTNDVSIQEVVEKVKSNVTNCFSRQPELREYEIQWLSEHGSAWFTVVNLGYYLTGVKD